ncbi:MAG: hypothetical protein HDR92_07105 [Bacteroides sp.]|nr:hypothetical protein [Bacteroides sp.]
MTKFIKILSSLILCICLFACQDDLTVLESVDPDSTGSTLLSRSGSDESDYESPVYTGEQILLDESALESATEYFKATNFSFVSPHNLYAVYTTDIDTVAVKTFQNIVKITDFNDNPVSEILVTLVPTAEYYSTHKTMDWSNFRFYEKNSDFSGYEIYADPENGYVFGIRYYQNGHYQYGSVLCEGDVNPNMKRAFLLKLAQNFSFIKTDARTRGDFILVEETIIIRSDWSDELGLPEIKIVTVDIKPVEAGGDHDIIHTNYLSSGLNGKYDNSDYLQKDDIEIEGNILFKHPIISSYLIDDIYPVGGYESSPCLAVALALQYFDMSMTPEQILSEVDSDDSQSFMNIFNDYITASDLESLISKYLNYYKGNVSAVHNAISTGKSVIAVSKTGYDGCIYKCMLIVGYTSGRDFIYLDPVTGNLKCRPNDLLDGYVFVITGKK